MNKKPVKLIPYSEPSFLEMNYEMNSNPTKYYLTVQDFQMIPVSTSSLGTNYHIYLHIYIIASYRIGYD